jgi:hypothetical protein
MRRTILVAVVLVLGASVAGGSASAVARGPADPFRCDDYQYWGIAGHNDYPFMYTSVNVPSEGPCGSPAGLYVDTPVYSGEVDGVEVTFAQGPGRVYTLTASGTVSLNSSMVDVRGTWTSEARPTVSHTADLSIPGCIVVNSTVWEWDTGTAALTIGATEYPSFANMTFSRISYSGVCTS